MGDPRGPGRPQGPAVPPSFAPGVHRAPPVDPRRAGHAFAGIPLGPGVGTRPVATCLEPQGCWIRSAPGIQGRPLVHLQPGQQVVVEHHLPGPPVPLAPGPGGFYLVRAFPAGTAQLVSGYVPSAWFA